MMPEQQHTGYDPDDLPPGTRLCGGRFTIEACLGRGGVATVYRVRSSDGRRLALKLMVSRRAADEDQRQRFDNEWLIGKALRGQPYVVSVDQAGRHDDGRPCFTMELVEAPTLAELIAHREITVVAACRLIREVASALDDLHMRGVVHRDIKPDNIIVTPQGVRLLDFGYAFTRGSEQVPRTAGLTRVEHRPGTPLYMAPEQADGAPPAPSFDVYALAATLHEALVGHAPYSDLPPALMMAHKCGGAEGEPSIMGRTVGLSKQLEQLVDDGLRRRPADRVRSAAEFRDRLDAVLVQLGDSDLMAGLEPRPLAAAGVVEPIEHERTLPRLRAVELPRSGEERDAIEDERPAAQEQSRAREAAAKVGVGPEAEAVEHEPEVAAKAEPAKTWAGVAAAVLVLVLGAGAWWGLAGEREQARASDARQEEREREQVPAVAAPAEEAGVVRTTEVVPTPEPIAGRESVGPVPEAVVASAPNPEKPSRKAKPTRQPEPCTDVAAEADTASRGKKWLRVLQLTKSARCWVDPQARIELRVEALSELGRYAECSALGATSQDQEVRRMAKSCAAQLDQEKSP